MENNQPTDAGDFSGNIDPQLFANFQWDDMTASYTQLENLVFFPGDNDMGIIDLLIKVIKVYFDSGTNWPPEPSVYQLPGPNSWADEYFNWLKDPDTNLSWKRFRDLLQLWNGDPVELPPVAQMAQQPATQSVEQPAEQPGQHTYPEPTTGSEPGFQFDDTGFNELGDMINPFNGLDPGVTATPSLAAVGPASYSWDTNPAPAGDFLAWLSQDLAVPQTSQPYVPPVVAPQQASSVLGTPQQLASPRRLPPLQHLAPPQQLVPPQQSASPKQLNAPQQLARPTTVPSKMPQQQPTARQQMTQKQPMAPPATTRQQSTPRPKIPQKMSPKSNTRMSFQQMTPADFDRMASQAGAAQPQMAPQQIAPQQKGNNTRSLKRKARSEPDDDEEEESDFEDEEPVVTKSFSMNEPGEILKPHQNKWLWTKLNERGSTFESHFKTLESFHRWVEQYRSFARHPVLMDPTIPSSDEEYVERVQQVFEAIVDMSEYGDTRKRSAPNRRRKGRKRAKDSSELDKLEDIIRVDISNVEIEFLSWQLLESAIMSQRGEVGLERWAGRSDTRWEEYTTFDDRWAQICLHMRVCKQSLHSLSRGSFFRRVANCPVAKSRRKFGNRRGNERKQLRIDNLVKLATTGDANEDEE